MPFGALGRGTDSATCASVYFQVGNLRYVDGCPGAPTGFIENINQTVIMGSKLCTTYGAQLFDLTLPANAGLPQWAQLWLGRLTVQVATVDDSKPSFIAITQACSCLAT
jgi:hypothetical protein